MIHLIVGNTGAGKTTYSHDLKSTNNGVIFSIDKWNNTLFLPDKKENDGLDWFLDRIERVELIISDLIIQLEDASTDTILDLGLSKFEHREKFRIFAKKHNFEIKIHFLDIDKETRYHRIMARNKEQGHTYEFNVSKENFDFMENWFERPTEKELEGGIIISK